MAQRLDSVYLRFIVVARSWKKNFDVASLVIVVSNIDIERSSDGETIVPKMIPK